MAISNLIPLAKPQIGRAEKKAVLRVLKSGVLAQGPVVGQFENNFSKFVLNRPCVAVNSGTSALHLGLLALGIGSGDEVIVPSFTFAATANSVALTGATPIFVDIDALTYNINPSLIEKVITKKTKAIQVVHLYGLPANMPEIVKIAQKYNLRVIEDAAQAHLAKIHSQPVGTFGDFAAFSFYPTKNMTSGEGGMIVFNDEETARKARLLRNQGMEQKYRNEIVGFNLRMTEIHAALGDAQLRKLTHWTIKRQENAAFLSNKLSNVKIQEIPYGFEHVFHQYTIQVPNQRDTFVDKLRKLNVEAGVYYPVPVHQLPAFKANSHLPVTEHAAQTLLSLPVHPKLTIKNLKKIVASTIKTYEELYG